MEEKVSIGSLGMRNGVILGMIATVISIGMIATDSSTNTVISTVSGIGSFVIGIGFMVYTINTYKQTSGGYVTFGEGFKGSFLVMFISSIISSVMQYVYLSFIDTEATDRMKAVAEEQLLQDPNMTEEALEMSMSMMEYIYSPNFMLIGGIVGSAIITAIIALIVAAIMKKEPEYY